MAVQVESVLVKYFEDLQRDPDVPYPEELGSMNQSGIDFEVSKLYEYMASQSEGLVPFLMDDVLSETEIIRLFKSDDDNIRISALLSIMSTRLPQLQLRARV